MTVLLVEIFQFKKTVTIILTSAVIVTFPTVGATFSYMFTADGYMMGNLLATLAVYMTKKWRYGFIPASLIFYVSVGIYQANLTIFLVIATILFIQWILTLSESPIKFDPKDNSFCFDQWDWYGIICNHLQIISECFQWSIFPITRD